MGKILSRADILNAQDMTIETVAVPEWGGDVLVCSLTGTERDQYEQSVVTQKGRDTRINMRNARAKLCAVSVVDEKRSRLFSEADITALGNKSAAGLQRVFDAACRLSGISESDVKELTENLEASPFVASSSD